MLQALRTRDGWSGSRYRRVRGGDNAAAQTSFIPLVTLGLPANPVRMFVGALVIHGIQPGPDVIVKQPALFWRLIASMWIGNALLLALNLPRVGVWPKVLRTPAALFLPWDRGLVLRRDLLNQPQHGRLADRGVHWRVRLHAAKIHLRADSTPAGFRVGCPLEENIHRALLLAKGDPMTFLRHPIGATLLVAAAVLLLLTSIPRLRRLCGAL